MNNPVLKQCALLSLGLAFLLVLQSCDAWGIRAKGDLITMNFDEKDFHGYDLSLSSEVEVLVGPEFKIEVTCEENVMPYVETKVSNGVLKVYFSRKVYDLDHMKIVVTAPAWDRFEVNGSGSIKVLDSIAGDLLRLDVSGSGDLEVAAAQFAKADLEVSGSGNVMLAGAANELQCEVSGSGNLNCLDFPVNVGHAEVSGSRNIWIHVLEQLFAQVSGSGNIIYEGTPQVSAHVSGSGNVRKK